MTCLMARIKTTGVITVLLGFTLNAAAQNSSEELKRSIAERSQKIAEFRALLNDPDQTVRLAALDVMLKSGDNAMRELAYGIGFSSADETMRALALKNSISDLETIVIKIESREDASEREKKAVADWGGAYTFDIKSFDEKSGRFVSAGSYVVGKGRVAGTALEFSQSYCNGSFRLGDGPFLEGTIGCKAGWSGQYAGRINLQ